MNQPKYFIGIDIAADSFVVAIFTTPEKPILTSDIFSNTPEGFPNFRQWLKKYNCDETTSIICMESTGVYSEQLCYFLYSQGYQIAVEPPLKVKRAFSQSPKKSDFIDSRQIAEYAYRFYDELYRWKPNNQIVEQVKVLLATREQFTKQLTANSNALQTIQRKYIQTPVANDMYQSAIEELKEKIKIIDKEIKKLINNHPTIKPMTALLMTIPGVGMLLASNIMVITMGFTKPVNAKQLAAYVGICPNEYQSGSSVYRRPRSAGYGPSRFRKLIHLASLSLRAHNEWFKRYFLRKVAEGKSGRLVINNIANKLIRIICAVIKSRTPFINNYRSVNPMLLKTA
jgi:transposase